MKIIYEPHPVTPERKAELRAQGYRIIDAVFAPPGEVQQPAPDQAEAEQRPRRGRPPKAETQGAE